MGTAAAHFRAMGADVQVLVVGGPPSLLDEARELVEALEARWSRFRPTSEISRLNQLAGRPVRVSQETLTLVRRALDGASVTAGRYDPTVLGAVLRAGYDRSFELLAADPPPGRSAPGLGYRRIAVDAARSTVTLPPGVGFDPGGIGKGLAADLLVHELLARGRRERAQISAATCGSTATRRAAVPGWSTSATRCSGSRPPPSGCAAAPSPPAAGSGAPGGRGATAIT